MSLQNNPYKLTSQVSLAPDPQLASMMEHYKGSGDAVSFSVVFNEVQRRKEIRDAAQSKMSGGPKQKVADQLIQEAKQAQMPAPPQGGPPQGGPPQGGPPQGGPPQGMPPGPPQEGGPPPDMGMGPQGGPPQEGGPPPDMAMGPQEGGPPQGMADGGYLLPEDTGIAQLPARNLENMAGGGLVSFAYGGDIPGYAGDEDSYVGEFGESGVPYPRDYTPPVDEEEEEPEEERPRPRFDSRGDYRAEMNKIEADQEKQDRDFETGRKGLGEAYANAEERDKEMTQRYSDEERSVKGMALMNFGLNLMQSRERGLAGIGEAGLAALPQYLSGRKELSSLKDKQRDYMQTVAEARRAEKLGLLKDMYGLDTDRTGRRIAQAGVMAQLGQGADEIRSRERIADMENKARSANEVKTIPAIYAPYIKGALEKIAAAKTSPERSAAQAAYLNIQSLYNEARAGDLGLDSKAAVAQKAKIESALITQATNLATPLGRAINTVNMLEDRARKNGTLNEQETKRLADARNAKQNAIEDIKKMVVGLDSSSSGAGGGGGGGGPDLDNPPWAN